MYLEQLTPPKPYRQGRLDALCGLYACINAQRRLQAYNQPDQKLPWRSLFSACLKQLSQTADLAQVMAEGLSHQQVWLCMQYLCNKLHRDFNIHTAIGRPLISKGPLPTRTILNSLEKNLAQPTCTAMIGLQGFGFNHWTVVSKLSAHHIHLHDSGGMKLIRRTSITYGKSNAEAYTFGDYFLPTGLIILKRR